MTSRQYWGMPLAEGKTFVTFNPEQVKSGNREPRQRSDASNPRIDFSDKAIPEEGQATKDEEPKTMARPYETSRKFLNSMADHARHMSGLKALGAPSTLSHDHFQRPLCWVLNSVRLIVWR